MVYFNQCNEGYIKNSTIENSSQSGLRFYSSSGLTIDNNTVLNNNGYGILNNSASINVSNCEISNNTSWAMFLDNVNVQDYPGNSGSGNGYDAFALTGNVTEDIELSSVTSGFPFVINGLLTVNDGISLTFPAGEIIKLNAGNIKVLGWLYSEGTSENPIVFTSFKDDSYGGDLNNDGILSTPAPGNWYTLTAQGNSNNDGKAFIDHSIFRYGGANYSGEASMVYFNQCNEGYIKNSTIEYSSQNGLRFYASSGIAVDNNIVSNNNGHGILNNAADINFSNCQISNNNSWAAYIDNATLHDYPGNSGSGNGYDAFALTGTVTEDLTLSSQVSGFPFVVNGLLTVSPGSILTFTAGEIVKMSLGIIKVNGSLYCDGHAKEPIIFTSFKDDETGGDLNNDGIVSAPAPGNWYGVYVNGNAANDGIAQLDHCVFKYGGANYSGEYALLYFYADHPESFVSYCTIEQSFQYGLRANNSAIKIRSSTFRDNNSYGIYVTGPALPDIGTAGDGGFNHFVNNDNGNYQLYYSGSENLLAIYNDWGYYTLEEIDEHIYDDNEAGTTGDVQYVAWFDPDDPTFYLDPEFTVDFDIIHVGGQVQFTDGSMGYPEPNSWEWDFQVDGSVDSEAQDPAYTYNSEGLKTVCLVVSNGAYEVTLIKENFINVGYYGAADLASITDVSDDQGGWVYVNFTKSEFDTNTLVTSTEYYTVQLNDGNGWFSAGYSSAYGSESYSVIAHTPFDSTANSNGLIDFRVIASMDEGTYVSEVMQGYSVDNLKPMAPTGIVADLGATVIQLAWDESPDDDFNYFAIYKSEIEGEFPEEPYHTLIETSYDDVIGADEYFYYMITAFDFAGNESDGSAIVSTYKSLELIIPEGWSGLSTYLQPVDSNIESMFAPVISNLVLIQNQSGVFWPDENVNTLVNWDVQNGYVVKADEQSSINITSTREKFNEIELSTGWNIIPVLSSNNVNVTELFLEADIEIAKDIAGSGVYWPELNINSMQSVISGKAYYVKANSDQTLLYPDLGQDGQVAELPGEPENLSPWNDVVRTPVSHLVGFPLNVLESLEKGDYIGAFTSEGDCAGWIVIGDEASAIAVNGQGQLGESGFADGEVLNYKLYRPATSEEFVLEVEYVPGQSQHGKYTADGLSVVSGLKLAPTGIEGMYFNDLKVYPNPAHDFVNISGIEGSAEVSITNNVGKEVFVRELILPTKVNLFDQPEGVYFMKIKTDKATTVEKLVIK
jgi:PKD repeat protein